MTRAYLAGGRDDGWRRRFEERFPDVEAFDPFRDSRQGGAYEFTNDDLGAIRLCDIVIANLTYPKFTGAALEFGFAHALGIPCFLVPYPGRVDAMMSAVSKATFTDVDSLFDFLERRVLKVDPQ